MTDSEAERAAGGAVRRRRVIFIPGYDPAHPRRYRELYRSEGATQARFSGYAIRVRGRTGHPIYGWDVCARIEGAEVATRIEALVWYDIVKRSMEGGVFAIYGHLARSLRIYLGSGALLRVMRLRKGPVIAAFFPLAVLLAQLALALAVAAGLGWGLSLVSVWLAPLGLVALWPILGWFRRHDGAVKAQYLMHQFAFAAEHAAAPPPELAARMQAFADHIAQALQSEADEVLVVGHSLGVQIAVSVLADLIRTGRLPQEGPALSFLSLGQVIPMAALLPCAEALRADLAEVSRSERITWVDVSAPGDGCSFALCDPVAVAGAGGPGKRGPLVLSAAFTQTLKPETWARLRWRFYRLHFQYLCAFDGLPGRPDDYDYFRITAGPMTLAARLGARCPSPARIERQLIGNARARATA